MLSTAYRKTLLPDGKISITIESGQPPEMISPLEFNWWLFLATVAMSFGALVWGYAYFNRLKWRFVERP